VVGGLWPPPTVISRVGRFGVNLILIPPIHSDNLSFTVGFQAKYRFNQADGAGPQTEHLRSVMEVSNRRGILIHLSQLPYSHR
jgi:hypothetical protein